MSMANCRFFEGPVNSGKTTGLLGYYLKARQGCGVLSIKVFDGGGKHIGYDALLLPSTERIPLLRMKGYKCFPQQTFCAEIGRWVYSQTTFDYINFRVFLNYLTFGSPVIIDEVGRLETKGKGFSSLLKYLYVKKASLLIGKHGKMVNF